MSGTRQLNGCHLKSFEELKWFVKDDQAIHCKTRKPTERNIDIKNSSHFLPDSEHVKWIWRTEIRYNPREIRQLGSNDLVVKVLHS